MLKYNPFHPSGIPRRDIILWADRSEMKKKLLDFIRLEPKKYVEILTILGDYGQGKTHALNFVYQECREKGFKVIKIANPGRSFVDLVRNVIMNITFDAILFSCKNHIDKNKDIILDRMKHDEFVSILSVEGLSIDKMIRYAFSDIDENLAIVLGQVYNNRNIDLSRSWLMGRNMTRTELGNLNVSRSISSDDYAAKILADVLKIIISEETYFILLIDELEDLANLMPSHAISYMKSFRRFIDENIAGLKLIVTFVADAFKEFRTDTGDFSGKSYIALYDRLAGNIYEPKNMTKDEVEEFVQDIVSQVSDKSINSIIDKKAIELLASNPDRNTPRRIITICYKIFDEVITKDSWPINEKVVTKWIDKEEASLGPEISE